MKRTPLLLLPLALAVSAAAPGAPVKSPTAAASPLQAAAGAFIDNYCVNCHNDQDLKGGLDLTDFDYTPADPANFLVWVKLHDRLESGEMPPKGKRRPGETERAALVATLASNLTRYEDGVADRVGRSTQRRLNRNEYENALRDLLDAPWLQVKDQLPEDGDAYHFNKVSSALDVSYVHLARYLDAADYALRQAMSVELTRPPTRTRRYYARDCFTIRNPGDDGNPDRQKFPVLGTQAQPAVLLGQAPMTVGAADPATREQEAMGWVQSNYSIGFGSTWGVFRAPVAGRYRLSFSGYTLWVGPGGTRRPTVSFIGQTPKGGDPTQIAVLAPEWYRPNFQDISPGRRYEPIAVYAKGSLNSRIGEFDLTPDPSVRSIGEVWLSANDVIVTDATRFFRSRPTGIPDGYTNPLAQRDGMPGVAFRWMDVEGPLYEGPQADGYRLLFGDLPLQKVADGAHGVRLDVVSDRPAAGARGAADSRFARSGGGFGRVPPTTTVTVEVVSADPAGDANRLLRGFMAHAYRHPVEEADVQLFLGLIHRQLDAGLSFAEAMIAGYTAVLSSPKFLCIEEPPGPLDDDAIATRLSLFLWNSAPDQELRELAARGVLHRPEVLSAQTDRMLDDPKAARFVEAFLDYWLDLRKVNDTSPSTTLYSDYAIDDALVEASLAETRLFFADLLAHDRPARNIVDSDYTFLNDRLAAHYGIPGVEGVAMRRVALPAGSPRGGLMTQASVLKITANGTTTSPVLRGKWVRERIMGLDVPPPPPAVPAVEVDIRGAVTIRQQLDKHRADPTCAACHSKIDPPGFALENFDVMGAWRDRYRASAEEDDVEPGFGKNGWPFSFRYALPVDATGQLPDGRAFKDIRDFKALLLADEPQIARNLARQLTVYATGAPIRFADRARIERIVEAARPQHYGVRSLVHQIVQSDLFLHK
jgi:mono/diheme cytochrome c family protein